MPPGRSPTVLDVARLAGVGKTTVSAVVHGREHVAPELRERVQQAIEMLGYRPNVSARNLKLQRSDVVGVVVGDLFDPFNAEITAHLERRAARAGLKLLLATSGESERADLEAIRALISHPVAAVLFVGSSAPVGLVNTGDGRVPFVFVAHDSALGPSAIVDNHRGGELAARHLLELGHRHLGFISASFGPLDPRDDDQRLAGFRHELDRHAGAGARATVVRLRDLAPEDRQTALTKLLAAAERPSAIFAATDTTALDVMQRASELGLSVPGDLSVVGFDNIAFSALDMVSLTTVAQPVEELSELAIGVVTALVNGADPGFERKVLQPTLAVRRSSGPPALRT